MSHNEEAILAEQNTALEKRVKSLLERIEESEIERQDILDDSIRLERDCSDLELTNKTLSEYVHQLENQLKHFRKENEVFRKKRKEDWEDLCALRKQIKRVRQENINLYAELKCVEMSADNDDNHTEDSH